jgi:hypothetical protein
VAVTSFDVQYSFSFVVMLLVIILTGQTMAMGEYTDLKEEFNFCD